MRISRSRPLVRGRQTRFARPSRLSLLVFLAGLAPTLAVADALAPPAEQDPYLAISGFYLVTDGPQHG